MKLRAFDFCLLFETRKSITKIERHVKLRYITEDGTIVTESFVEKVGYFTFVSPSAFCTPSYRARTITY